MSNAFKCDHCEELFEGQPDEFEVTHDPPTREFNFELLDGPITLSEADLCEECANTFKKQAMILLGDSNVDENEEPRYVEIEPEYRADTDMFEWERNDFAIRQEIEERFFRLDKPVRRRYRVVNRLVDDEGVHYYHLVEDTPAHEDGATVRVVPVGKAHDEYDHRLI